LIKQIISFSKKKIYIISFFLIKFTHIIKSHHIRTEMKKFKGKEKGFKSKNKANDKHFYKKEFEEYNEWQEENLQKFQNPSRETITSNYSKTICSWVLEKDYQNQIISYFKKNTHFPIF